MPLALELTGVDFAYGQGPQVLKSIDLRVEQGEFVAIAGPNGGGKTTLLRIALGLERPTHGEVSFTASPHGASMRGRASATSRSGRRSACTRRRPCATSSRPDERR